MQPKQLFVERLANGNYGVKKPNINKPIVTAHTQEKAKKLD